MLRHVACVGACAVVAFAYAVAWIKVRYVAWDDEGFLLFTLRQWLAGTSLYDSAYTEYGPFYYLAYSAWFRMSGMAADHDALRWSTIVLWVAVSLGGALCVWTSRRSLAWTSVTILATAVVLRALTGEPGHPQGLVWMLLTAVPVLMTARDRLGPRPLLVTLGAIVTMVTLVKINVGVFVSLSLLAALGPEAWPRGFRRIHRYVVPAAAVMMPVVLMWQHMGDPLIRWQCALGVFGVGSVISALRHSPWRQAGAVGWLASGAVLAAVLLAGSAAVHGESVHGLLNGVLLQPLRFSRVIQAQAADVSQLTIATALATLSGLLLLRGRGSADWRPSSLVRTVTATVTALLAVMDPPLAAIAGPVVLWMAVPHGDPDTARAPLLSARTTVALATFASFVVFPVPGTQTSLAAALILWAAIIGLPDNVTDRPRVIRVVPLLALASGVTLLCFYDGRAYAAVERVPSGLPGSRLITLDPEQAATFNEIVRLVGERCETLATLPGMNSFNIWTGLPRPNEFATSAAMVLFDEPAQRRLTTDFGNSPRPCVIESAVVEQWSSMFRRPGPERQPFIDFVRQDLVLVYSRAEYAIRVPRRDAPRWSDRAPTARP